MKDEKKFIEKQKVANKDEYVIKKSPSKTWWGKVMVAIILIGMVGLLLISAIVAIVRMYK